MPKTDIKIGCTVLDRDDCAWRVTAINPPEQVEIDDMVIEIKSVEVTDGVNTVTKLLGELDRAEMTPAGKVLARGYR